MLGISSGSRLFVGFFLLAATPIVTEGFSPYVIFLAAFAGALAAMALVLAVSSRVQNLAMLLVIGMMIGYICDAGTDFMITFAESSQLQNFTIWTMGSFSGMTWATLGASALITIPTVVLVFLLSKPLGAYLLGENYAKSMGVNVKASGVALILLSSILSACVTAFAGPISFVDRRAPHHPPDLPHLPAHGAHTGPPSSREACSAWPATSSPARPFPPRSSPSAPSPRCWAPPW